MSVRDLVTAGDPSALDEQALVRFLQSRRWFAGGQQLAGTAVLEIIPLLGNPPLAVALIETRYITGIHGVTQLLLGVRPATGDGATIQGEGDIELYEAFTAPADVPQLAARMLALADVEHGGTTLECRSTPDGAAGDMAGSARSLDADQSNSSIVLDDRFILKCYRRVEAGLHPELEVLQFLAARDFPHIPTLAGWYGSRGGAIDATLGILQHFRAGARDGWDLAGALLADGQAEVLLDYIAELGTTIAALHTTLASDHTDPVFAPQEITEQHFALLCASIDEDVCELCATVAEHPVAASLHDRRDAIRDRIRAIATTSGLGRRIRDHGDLHLGQALWWQGHWELIDFEGEPTRPLRERRRMHSPLRDVAGMLRSIDYAVAVAVRQGGDVDPQWRDRARQALLERYLAHMDHSGLLPTTRDAIQDLLALHELEKALYELRYEIDHRPDWVEIPLAAIHTMIGTP